jgi:glycosyltransferase involved in cell wall biosynthesis
LEQLKKRAAFHGLENRVRVWEGQEARLFMPGFDALIGSSDFEGFPLVFIEALQAGVPIITTPVGGAEECVVHGKTGFVAKDFEPGSLGEILSRYASLDAREAKSMAAQALRQGDLFSVLRMGEAMRKLYRSICER